VVLVPKKVDAFGSLAYFLSHLSQFLLSFFAFFFDVITLGTGGRKFQHNWFILLAKLGALIFFKDKKRWRLARLA